MKTRRRISEMTHHERRMFLVNQMEKRGVVKLCLIALRAIEREYAEIGRILKKAKKKYGED